MPQTTQVQSLLDEAAFRLNLPAFGVGEFVTMADALRVLKGSCGRLAAFLSGAFASELFVRTDTLPVPADLGYVSLPEDFESLRTVHLLLNDTRYELRAGHPAGEATATGASEDPSTSGAWTATDLPSYWLEDMVLRFSRAPSSEMSIEVSYVGGLTFDDEDSFLVLGAGWDEFLINDLCEKVRVREQKDASEFVRMRAEAAQLILKSAAKRDRFAPMTVRDVRPRATRNMYWPSRR